MKRFFCGTAAALVLIVTGCTPIGGESTSSVDESPAIVETGEETTGLATQEESQATITQWSSIVSGKERAIRETASKLELDSCGWFDHDNETLCRVYWMEMVIGAKELHSALRKAGDADAFAFIGHPPAEISPNVVRTQSLAERVVDMGDEISTCDYGSDLDGCNLSAILGMAELSKLISELDAWEPYK